MAWPRRQANVVVRTKGLQIRAQVTRERGRAGKRPDAPEQGRRRGVVSARIGTAPISVLSNIAAGVVLVLLTWPYTSLMATTGLDPSWQSAMDMVAIYGLDYGTEINLTYGPLGFLASPTLYYPSTAGLATLYYGITMTALMAAVVWSLRRSFPLWLALVLGFLLAVVAASVRPPEMAIALAFIGCVAITRRQVTPRTRLLLLVGLGALGGGHLLIKFSVGIIVTGLVGLAALLSIDSTMKQRIIDAAIAGGTALAAALLGWVVTGNPLGAIPEYLRASSEIASGYSDAMSTAAPERMADYALALVGLALFALVAWWSLRRRRGGALAVGVLSAFMLFGLFKAGFVRHDLHVTFFFSNLVVASAAFAWRKKAVPVALVIAALSVILFLIIGGPPRTLLNPVLGLRAAADHALTLLDADRRTETIIRSKEQMRAEYALDETTLELLQEGTVHVHPWETAVVWAYDLQWRPVPVFQSYTSYTPYLDQENAEVLRSPDAPDHILQETPRAIDGRYGEHESPETLLAILCNYVEVHATEKWQVLEKVPNRCGEEQPLGTVEITEGEAVEVPASTDPAGHLVVGSVTHMERSLLDRIAQIFWKPGEVRVELGMGGTFRGVRETLSGPLLLDSTEALEFSEPFEPADVERIGVDVHDYGGDAGPVTIEFAQIPISHP